MLDTLNDICADYGLTPVGIRHALDQYKKVIYELTNGRLSKLTYNGNFIISEAEDCFKKDYEEDHGWISVKDHPPEKDKDVIIYGYYVGPSGETYPTTIISDIEEFKGCECVPIAWMPLPEPPKE